MPRWASRITLEIIDVRVERIQDISEEGVKRGGILERGYSYDGRPAEKSNQLSVIPAWFDFRDLWNSINAKRGYGWDKNPWVWVIEFKRVD